MKTTILIRMARVSLVLLVGLSLMAPRAGAFSFSFWGTITDVDTAPGSNLYGLSINPGDTFSGRLLFYPDTAASTGGIFQQTQQNPGVPSLLTIWIGDSPVFFATEPGLAQYLGVSDGQTEDEIGAFGEGSYRTAMTLALTDSLGMALDDAALLGAWDISEWTSGRISISDLPFEGGTGRIEGTIAGTRTYQIPDAGRTAAFLGLGLAGLIILARIRRQPRGLRMED